MPKLAAALVLALVALAALAPEGAANIGLGVAPSKIDLGIQDAGTRLSKDLTLKSTGDAAINLSVLVHDFTVAEGDRFQIFDAGTQPNSSARWLTVEPQTLKLEPGEVGRVRVSMAIPQGAPAGGHYSMLVLRFEPVTPPAPPALAPKGAVNVQILVQVAGDINVRGAVSPIGSFSTTTPTKGARDPLSAVVPFDLPVVHVPGPIAMRSRYAVEGNAYLKAKAVTTVKDFQGNEIATLESGPYTAMPNSDVIVEAIWEEPPLFGIFTAFTQIDDGTEPPYEFQRFTFVVAPWKSVAAAGGGAIGTAFGLRTLLRVLHRRRLSLDPPLEL